MIYDENWRMQHPQLQAFMQANPNVWTWLEQWGEYDTQNQWHDAYWWHQNNRQWFYSNHLEWVALDPRWRDQAGAYDNQHAWHDAYWWHKNNRRYFYTVIRNGSGTIRSGASRMATMTTGTHGTMLTGGIRTTASGFTTTVRSGSRTIRSGATRMATTIASAHGTMPTGGIGTIATGS
jgi:hypothetical protein